MKRNSGQFFARLAREYSSLQFVSSGFAVHTSSIGAIEYQRIPDRGEITELSHRLIREDWSREWDAFVTGNSTCKCYDQVVFKVAGLNGVSESTVRHTISSVTFPSNATK
jgi:hypothetical protein